MADTLLQKTLRQISESLPEGGEQRLPTEQPVTAEPDWEQAAKGLEAFLKQGQGGTSNADAVNRWIAEQAAQGREYIYDPNKDLAYSIAMNSAVPLMSNLGGQPYSNFDPNNPAASMAQIFRFDKEGTNSINAPLAYRSGENYILTDASGKNVLGRAASPEEMQQLVNLADAQKYGWTLYQGNEKGEYTPGAGIFGKSDPRLGGVLGALINYGLPIGVGLLTGGIGALPSLGAGTTAGLMGATSLTSGILSGKSAKDALLQGALAAGTAGLLKGTPVGDAINKAVNNVPVVGDALRGISKTLDLGGVPASTGGTDIVVNAARNSAPGLITGGIGGLANLASASAPTTQGPEPRRTDYGDKVEPTPDEAPIVVTGQRLNNIINMIANGAYMNEVINAGYSLDEYDAALNKFNADREIVSRGQLAPELPPVPVQVPTPGPLDNVAPPSDTIVAEAQRKAELPPIPTPSFTPGPVDYVAPPGEEIVVTRKQEAPVTGIDAIINSVAPSLNAPTMDVPPAAPGKKMGVGDYIRLGLLVPPLLKGIGGSGNNSTLPISSGSTLGFTPMNRSFTGGGIGGAAGGTFDPFTYGQALPGAQTAEYEFFQPYRMTAANPNAAYNAALAKFDAYQNDLASQVASGELTPDDAKVMAQSYAINAGYQTTPATASATAAPAFKDGGEVDDDMVRHLVEWHKGGGHTGPGKVKGIGSGQEDLIPAWLSDGEYVWSAQDVADLGDGSTDEGVRRLDKMRQMVRRRAGRKDVKKIAKPQRGIDTMLKAVGGSV